LSLGIRSSGGVGTSNPVAHLNLHWCLREVDTANGLGVVVGQVANFLAINDPLHIVLGPDDGIIVPSSDSGGHGVVDSTVVGGNIALTEKVALDGGIGSSKPLPINLIEVIRFEDETADDSSSWGGLHADGDIAEHDVLGCAHGRGASLGGNLEVGAVLRIVRHSSAIRITPARGGGGARNLGEVGDEGFRVSNTIVGRASLLGGVTVCEGLGSSELESRQEHCRGGESGTHVRCCAGDLVLMFDVPAVELDVEEVVFEVE